MLQFVSAVKKAYESHYFLYSRKLSILISVQIDNLINTFQLHGNFDIKMEVYVITFQQVFTLMNLITM